MQLKLPVNCLSIFLLAFATPGYGIAPIKILEKAEAIRNPTKTYECDVLLVDNPKGKKPFTQTFHTLVKGREKALVKFLTPEVDRGTRVLMVGADMWIYVRSAAKPIRIAPQQKIAGNAAYGDVSRLNFVGNYTAKLLKDDKIDSTAAYVLDLVAVPGRPITYEKIEYWIEKKTFRPMKAVYMSAGGKPIREAWFKDFKKILGAMRPEKMEIINFIKKDQVTELTFTKTKSADLPDLLFDKVNLGRD